MGQAQGGQLQGSQPQSLRRQNRQQVVAQLFSGQGQKWTRPELAQCLGLSKVTVNAVVQELVERRLVELGPGPAQGMGRAPQVVTLHPDLGQVLGLDAQPGGVRLRRQSLARQDVTDGFVPARRGALSGALLAALERGRDPGPEGQGGPLRSVVIAVPAPVDAQGRLGEPNALPELDAPALQAQARRLGLDLSFENDANLVALAARPLLPERCHLAALVERETGTGLGLLLAGELYRGGRGRAGELGRAPWPSPSGARPLEHLPEAERLRATAYLLAGLGQALDLDHLLLALPPERSEALRAVLAQLLDPGVTLLTEPDPAGAALAGACLLAGERARRALLGSLGADPPQSGEPQSDHEEPHVA